MAEHKIKEWFKARKIPGLDPVGHWIIERLGIGAPGRLTGVMFRLKEGDLAQFVADWNRFAEAVIEQGGLPDPRNGQNKPLTTAELRESILPPQPEAEPEEPYSVEQKEMRKTTPPEDVVHSLFVRRSFLALLASEITVEGDDPRGRLTSLVIGVDVPETIEWVEGKASSASGTTEAALAAPESAAASSSDTVITAVIDGGLPLAHARFRSEKTKTRIEHAWVQRAKVTTDGLEPVGAKFTKAQIDQFLQDADIGGQVDEDMVYRLTGQADFGVTDQNELGYAVTHGAHVMDIACGREWDDPVVVAGRNPIICVQLPNMVTADTSGQSLEPFVVEALKFIREKAQQMAAERGEGPLKLVLNFSYGLTAGQHDGHGPMESALDQFIQARPADTTTVVLPAGNQYLSRDHVMITKSSFAGNALTLTWRAQPDDRTDSFLEMWMPSQEPPPGGSRLTLRLKPPGGQISPPVPEDDKVIYEWRPGGAGTPVKATIGYFRGTGPSAKGSFHLSTAKTRDLENPHLAGPSGDWLVEVEDTALGATETVHGWIARDETLYPDYFAGRQSYFVDENYQVFNPPPVTPIGDWSQTDTNNTPVQKQGLMSALATGHDSIAIGGFMLKNGQAALYSAGGPTLNPGKQHPDAMAVSDTSRIHYGTIAAGSRSGSVAVLSGTSVSAPKIARRAVEVMLGGAPIVTRDTVRDWAIAENSDFRPPPPLAPRAGNGRAHAPAGRTIKRIDLP